MTSRGSKFADASQCRWFRTSVREIYSSPLPISGCARSRWICSTTVQVCQTCVKACNTDELIANTNAANVPCHISTFLYTVEIIMTMLTNILSKSFKPLYTQSSHQLRGFLPCLCICRCSCESGGNLCVALHSVFQTRCQVFPSRLEEIEIALAFLSL